MLCVCVFFVCVCVCLSVCLPACLSFRLSVSVCLSVCLFVCLSVCLSLPSCNMDSLKRWSTLHAVRVLWDMWNFIVSGNSSHRVRAARPTGLSAF